MIFSKIIHQLGGYHQLRLRYHGTDNQWLKKIYAFLNRRFEAETNAYLPLNNSIAGPINFLHGTSGVFISGGAVIGKNCTIYHQVTIGSNMLVDSKNLGSPTIGDNVLIGAGAKIIGKVRIGNNCRIGANAVVSIDLPDNSIALSGGLQVFQRENLDNRIYQFAFGKWGYRRNGEFIAETDEAILDKLRALE
jgi:serine O-acetyltransferase